MKRRITSTKRFREQARKKKQEDKEQRRTERLAARDTGAAPSSELNEALVDLEREESQEVPSEGESAEGEAKPEGGDPQTPGA